MNRKEFIKTGGRILILAGMAATTGYFVVNKKIETTCSETTACSKCGQYSACNLPKAEAAREFQEYGN